MSYYQHSFVSVDRTTYNLPSILARLAALLYVSSQTERIYSRAFNCNLNIILVSPTTLSSAVVL